MFEGKSKNYPGLVLACRSVCRSACRLACRFEKQKPRKTLNLWEKQLVFGLSFGLSLGLSLVCRFTIPSTKKTLILQGKNLVVCLSPAYSLTVKVFLKFRHKKRTDKSALIYFVLLEVSNCSTHSINFSVTSLFFRLTAAILSRNPSGNVKFKKSCLLR